MIEKTKINEIIALHSEIYGLLKTSLEKAIRIGELLNEQKASLKHGEFIPWIEKNLPFNERTARRYINIFRNRHRLKSDKVSGLNQAYKLLEAPKETSGHVTVNSRDIESNPFFDTSCLVPESIHWWQNTIKHIGLYWITALRVKSDRYENICNHNRLVAIKLLGTCNVPAVIVPEMDDEKMKNVLEQFDYQEFHQNEIYKRQNDDVLTG